MKEYPKYIALDKNGSSALRLCRVTEKCAIYERPEDTGYWTCYVSYNDSDQLVILNTMSYLNGKFVYPISEELFNKDNGYGS